MLQQQYDSNGKPTGTKLQHLQSVEKMSGKTPEALQIDEPDESIAYVLDIFYQLKRSKGQKITFSEIQAYCSMMACKLVSWEIEVIMKIDDLFETST